MKTDKKIRLVFDATILKNFSRNNTSRAGIFFVTYNLLRELKKNKNLDVKIYTKEIDRYVVKHEFEKIAEFRDLEFITNISKQLNRYHYWRYRRICYKNVARPNYFFYMIIKSIASFYKIIHMFNTQINTQKPQVKQQSCDVFLSACFKVPDFIANDDKIKKFTMLHDIVPILFPKDHPNEKHRDGWYYQMIETLNSTDNYFANSHYTKQDFLTHFPFLNKHQITVIPLSTGLNYTRTKDIKALHKTKIQYSLEQKIYI